jgi:hypothetical protein
VQPMYIQVLSVLRASSRVLELVYLVAFETAKVASASSPMIVIFYILLEL